MNAADRQEIPIVRDGDDARIIREIHTALNVILAARCRLKDAECGFFNLSLSWCASAAPLAERALRSWAAGKPGIELREDIARYDKAPYFKNEQIRSVDLVIGKDRVAWVQFDAEPIVKEARVTVDADAMWSPADDRSMP